jgi:hypothetical protein
MTGHGGTVFAAPRGGGDTIAGPSADTAFLAATVRALEARKALLAGAVAALAAPDEHAPELFEAALADPGAQQWPFDLARVHLLYGERLRRAARRTPAPGRWAGRAAVHPVSRPQAPRLLGGRGIRCATRWQTTPPPRGPPTRCDVAERPGQRAQAVEAAPCIARRVSGARNPAAVESKGYPCGQVDGGHGFAGEVLRGEDHQV